MTARDKPVNRHSPLFLMAIVFILLSTLFFSYAAFSANITYKTAEELNLPILKIETENGKKIKSKTKYLDATFEFEGSKGKCKIRGHGNTTWKTRELLKKPYLMKTNEEVSLAGLPKSRKWILLANTADKTSLRNKYALYLAKNVFNSFKWSPEQKFITLFLNGRYEGLYELTEKVEIQPGRIDIETSNGSFLAEINMHSDRVWNFATENKVPVSIRKPEGLSEDSYRKMQDQVQELEQAILSAPSSSLTELEKLIDINSLADWYLVNEFTKNHDAKDYSSNFFYFDGEAKKFFFGPVWDFDISAGNISWDGCENPEGFWIRNSTWMKSLFSNAEFNSLVEDRWNERKALLKTSFDWINGQAHTLSNAVELNDAVWKNIGRRQWPHAPGWKKRKSYMAEVSYMTSWCKARFDWMDSQMQVRQ